MLGKRKRDHAAVPRVSLHEIDVEEATNITNAADSFKQYFEAKFEPLLQEPLVARASSVDENDFENDSQSDSSDWNGFTDDDTSVEEVSVEEVRVIEHTVVSEVTADSGALEGKHFMSSKPPVVGKTISVAKVTPRQSETKEDVADAANLKKDLELQRLLKESHLLERPSLSSAPIVNRDKVTDLRLQTLGAKASLFIQQKMPLAHRRGIKAKAIMREEVRRKEAQENGVILEKASKSKRVDTRRRDRGIGTPAVGKFAGGTLKLSQKDIHEINGPRQAVRGRRKGKR